MRWMKLTLIAGLGIWLNLLLIFGGSPKSQAQSIQVLDLSQPKLRDRIQSSGFITSKPIPSWGSIVGTKDAGINLSEGEVVYLKLKPGKEVKVGDRFSIVRLGKSVTHPVTKKKLGHLVVMPGELTILEVKDPLVTAKINKSYRSIYQEDMIVPPTPILPQNIPIRHQKKIDGVVLLSLEDTENISENEFIFIDRGNNDGVMVGDLFSIYQKGRFDDDHLKNKKVDLPLAKVGEAVVISAQEETSTALVTRSSQAIYIGDRVVSGRD